MGVGCCAVAIDMVCLHFHESFIKLQHGLGGRQTSHIPKLCPPGCRPASGYLMAKVIISVNSYIIANSSQHNLVGGLSGACSVSSCDSIAPLLAFIVHAPSDTLPFYLASLYSQASNVFGSLN